MATILDTHESVKNLKGAGFNEAQAEALVAEFSKSQESMLKNLATKEDLVRVESSLRGEIKDVKADIKELELRMDNKLESYFEALWIPSLNRLKVK